MARQLIAAISIGEGIPNSLAVVDLLALATMILDLIDAWNWETVGGLLILSGLAYFAIVNLGIRSNVVFGPRCWPWGSCI